MKTLITQSNYIPWKGFFDAIHMVDTLILYDEMQYTKRDWRNRNKIKTENGLQWLSIPVQVKGKFYQKINNTEVSGQDWRQKHWNMLEHNYKKAPYFKRYADELKKIYLSSEETNLSTINRNFIELICGWLNITTTIKRSCEFSLKGDKTEKLVDLCLQLGATDYYTGPAAKNYINTELFHNEEINIHWIDYTGYAEYPQLFGAFEHEVTILDLLFNTGDRASNFMKSF